jgi:hypothetical protein
MMWRAGRVARIREERQVYKVLEGKPVGKRPLARPRGRWEDWIMALADSEIGWRMQSGFSCFGIGTGGGFL